jgi:type VI protein secretion system component VasK
VQRRIRPLFSLGNISAVMLGLFALIIACTIYASPTEYGAAIAKGPGVVWATAVVGFLVVVLHACWLWGLARAMDRDRRMAIHYTHLLQCMSNSAFEADFERQLNSNTNRIGRPWTSCLRCT